MKFTAIARKRYLYYNYKCNDTNNQLVNAKGKYEKMNRLYDTNKLHQYYSGPNGYGEC